MPYKTAARDLRDKIKLEREFAPRLNRYHSLIVKEFKRRGVVFDMSEFDALLSDILTKHYTKVTDLFSSRLSVQATPAEQQQIDEILTQWGIQTAPGVARIINETTQGQMVKALEIADTDQTVRELTGRESRLTRNTIAANVLDANLKSRSNNIATTETQTAAEHAKAVEVSVLSGGQSHLIKKEWVSVGDSVVRTGTYDHLAADGQRVNSDKPFIVSGEPLMFPGDRSLGASIGNIARCRCSAVYDEEAIYNSVPGRKR
jgi:hypothetical protein